MTATIQSHIIIVDDDLEIIDLVQNYLRQQGLQVSSATHGKALDQLLLSQKVDLIILDLMLPGEDGISICRRLRAHSDIPIIMLSAAGEETDRVIGLEIGADDYMAKPFGLRELLARVNSLLRRQQQLLTKRATGVMRTPDYLFAGWTLQTSKNRLISPAEVVVSLSHAEYRLLLAFLEHPQRTLSREQLMGLIKDEDNDLIDRGVDVLIGRLRKKIEQDSKNPELVMTIRGVGYQFNAEVIKQ